MGALEGRGRPRCPAIRAARARKRGMSEEGESGVQNSNRILGEAARLRGCTGVIQHGEGGQAV